MFPVSFNAPIGKYTNGTPGQVTTLAISDVTSTTLVLTYTVVANQLTVQARRSPTTITALNWASSTVITDQVPLPSKPQGLSESFLVTGLTPSTLYYFAVKAQNAVGGVGLISNVVSTTTLT